MSTSNRRIAAALVPLLVTWPTEGMPAERLKAYELVLGDLEPELLEAAVVQCLATCRFFPRPAEIRDAAFDLRKTKPSCYDSWAEVTEQIRHKGLYGRPEFSDPAIEDAVRQVGGWQMLCLSENPVADRARFVEAYEQADRRSDKAERMLPQVKALAARLALPEGARALLKE